MKSKIGVSSDGSLVFDGSPERESLLVDDLVSRGIDVCGIAEHRWTAQGERWTAGHEFMVVQSACSAPPEKYDGGVAIYVHRRLAEGIEMRI